MQNSARSIIAETVVSQPGAGKFKGYSAGRMPSGKVHPFALDLLSPLQYPTEGLRPKSWEEFSRPDVPKRDFVFTVCDNAAAEVCPAWSGQPVTAHWGLPDPSAVEGTEVARRVAFANTHRMLYQRVGISVNLPVRSLGSLSGQRRLDDIGRSALGAKPENARC
jgi:arsenate reductase (thioredoxin)